MKQSSWRDCLFPTQPVFAVCSRWSTGLQTQTPGWHLCQCMGTAAPGGHVLLGQPFQKLAAGFVIYLLLLTFSTSVQQATAQGTVTRCKSGVWFLLEQVSIPNSHKICLEKYFMPRTNFLDVLCHRSRLPVPGNPPQGDV